MKEKTRDNLIYLGVGLGIAAAFATYMFVSERMTGAIRPIPDAVLWGILSTPVIVGIVLERFWKYRRRRVLWLLAIAAASVNVLVITASSYWGWHQPVLVWSTMTALVLGVAMVLIGKILRGEGSAPEQAGGAGR
jgi:peptidoglycan/LPS O-acetylase OafA/YrhL